MGDKINITINGSPEYRSLVGILVADALSTINDNVVLIDSNCYEHELVDKWQDMRNGKIVLADDVSVEVGVLSNK